MRDSVFKILLSKDRNISFCVWLKITLLEIYLGEQLLEMISNTASYNHETEELTIGSESNGWKKPLIDYIPSTYLNAKLKDSILRLLRIKYLYQYKLIKKVDSKSLEYDDKATLYKLNHASLHLLTELKLAYNTIWVGLNLTIDLIVYLCTKDLATTLAVGGAIEFIRRFKL
ncbi:TPA: hypothetical protein RQJ98_004598 [Vibrio vulnificus]|uniref:hypothetical protein n=1 Tax=Vibrio vulnificus TaxID=672 RepID=UPI0005F234C2|nr:hypothetical protein [Vibrio vulnificus]EIZ1008064.1 hypothetical protein [Vibrio vulnificus]MCA3916869.1 hypothetical protein [Vibrio vulnificus]HAS6364275.1 hypothetical protein [Vibrio vulnificus]HDY7544921.1 hypothetical protein [Vibrio vulnificus]HDY7685936.1 hypothetical protein [Vibrio vulnificus]